MNHWKSITEKIKKAPKDPGVYIFHSKNEPIYVGKASNLRSRLRSYLVAGDFKNDRLQENAVRLELLPLRSEIEALLKESELIKKLNPFYNVLWRDDKSYFYAVITKEKFPRIFVTHKKSLPTAYYLLPTHSIGPFTEGRALRLVLRMLRRRFPYCTCPTPHLRTCLNAQIGNCFGFCCRKSARPSARQIAQYKKNIHVIKNFLLGLPVEALPGLRSRSSFGGAGAKAGQALKPEEREALEKILAHREFLDDTLMNADYTRIYADTIRENPRSNPRQSALLIEGYDISHLSGRETVSGMTAWSFNGEKLVPRKDFWRKFIIRTAKPADDPAAMRETLRRRLNHPEWPYPDITIIDGGLAQFRAARQAVREAGLERQISVRSFAKPEQLVYGTGEKPVSLNQAPEELKKIIPEIIMHTHNFAIRFHRARRKKAFLNPKETMIE